jgi:hypothetical protein
MRPPTIAPTIAMKNILLPSPPLWPNERKRDVTKKNSKTAATTAEKTPVMTPINTSFALQYISACLDLYVGKPPKRRVMDVQKATCDGPFFAE